MEGVIKRTESKYRIKPANKVGCVPRTAYRTYHFVLRYTTPLAISKVRVTQTNHPSHPCTYPPPAQSSTHYYHPLTKKL